MTEYNIDQEAAIAAVTTNTEFDAFDLDNTKRVKKATALQIAAFSRTAAAGHNLTATTDPGAGNDNTQGYGPLSIWLTPPIRAGGSAPRPRPARRCGISAAP